MVGIFIILDDLRLDLRRDVLLEDLRLPRRPLLRRRVAHPFLAARLRFALEVVRLEVLRLEVVRFAGFRRAVLRLEEVLLVDLRLARRRDAHPFLAAAERFALEVRGLRLEEVRFAEVLRALRFRVAAAFLPAADLLRLLAARVRAAFFAEAERFALVVVLFAVLRRAAGFLVDLRVRAIGFTFLVLDDLALFGGFTRVSVPSAIAHCVCTDRYKGARHGLAQPVCITHP
jgi:hypothetical protein